MAEEMHGHCIRYRYLRDHTVRTNRALFWIIEPEREVVRRFQGLTPQIFEPINPRIDPTGVFQSMCQSFDYLLLNTESAIHWLGNAPEKGWRSWVIPHHHCNFEGYCLPEERIARPKVIGYLGESVHLHDTEVIQSAVEKLGMRFLSADAYELDAYKEIDIGIAWTRRDALRDQTRSNIKLTNFNAHGIPSVVCDYESYRDTDRALGGESCLIRGDLEGFIEGIAELANSESLRRKCYEQSIPALKSFGRPAIAKQYWDLIDEMRSDFTLRQR